MNRRPELLKAAASLAALVGLLAGVPFLLIRAVSWPFPTQLPTWGELSWTLTNGQIDDRAWIKLFACICWFAWLQLAGAVALEVVGQTSRATARIPGFVFAQGTASRLVASATLLGVLLRTATPAVTFVLPAPQTVVLSLAAAARGAAQPVIIASQATVPAQADDTWTVTRGESLWSIAETVLGDGNRWPEIRTLNVGRTMPDGTTLDTDFWKIRSGWQLILPVAAPIDSIDAAESHEVTEGESFWAIAEHLLEDGLGRIPSDAEIAPVWNDIVNHNAERLLPPGDPDLIYPGQILAVPAELLPHAEQTASEPPVVEAEDVASPVVATTSPPTEKDEPTATTTLPTTTSTTAPAGPAGSAAAAATPLKADAGNESPSRLLVATLTALGAGGVLLALRRLRRIQQQRRTPGSATPLPSPGALAVEEQLRMIGDAESVDWLAGTQALLSNRLRDRPADLPSIICARAGKLGIELLLEVPAPAPESFVSVDDDRCWRVARSVELEQLQPLLAAEHPFAPALVTIGTTEAGELLADLERMGVTAVEGTAEQTDGFLRSVAVALATLPWCSGAEIGCVGFDSTLSSYPNLLAVEPDDPWIAAQAGRVNLEGDGYRSRVEQDDPSFPAVVVVGSTAADTAATLAEIAQRPGSNLVVLAAGPLAGVSRRIVINGEQATLEPFGLSFRPTTIDQRITVALGDSFASATERADGAVTDDPSPAPPVALDTSGSPSKTVVDLIAEVMAPKPVEARILQRTPTVDGLLSRAGQPKIVEIIAYLAAHRGIRITKERLTGALWPKGVESRSVDTMVSKVRESLGPATEGGSRIPSTRNAEDYRLTDDVGCDWTRAQQLLAAAVDAPPADRIALLEAALSLVGGAPFADVPSGTYAWGLDDVRLRSCIERTLVDAANELGELALAAGNPDLAETAARQGLVLIDTHEALYRILMRAAHAAGDSDAVEHLYHELQRAVTAVDPSGNIDSCSAELFQQLRTARGR